MEKLIKEYISAFQEAQLEVEVANKKYMQAIIDGVDLRGPRAKCTAAEVQVTETALVLAEYVAENLS